MPINPGSEGHRVLRATGLLVARPLYATLVKNEKERKKRKERIFQTSVVDLGEPPPFMGGGGGSPPIKGFHPEINSQFQTIVKAIFSALLCCVCGQVFGKCKFGMDRAKQKKKKKHQKPS